MGLLARLRAHWAERSASEDILAAAREDDLDEASAASARVIRLARGEPGAPPVPWAPVSGIAQVNADATALALQFWAENAERRRVDPVEQIADHWGLPTRDRP